MGKPDTMEIIAAWEDTLDAENLSERTIDLYTYGAWRFLRQAVRGPIAAGTEDHVVAFLKTIGKRSEAKRKYLTGLRSLYAYCMRRRLVRHDPTVGIKIRGGRIRRPQAALEPEELYLIFCHLYEKEPRRAWAMAASFGLGTRRMEISSLSPEDIDWTTGEIGEAELKHCKFGKTRKVPLSPVAREALLQLKPWWNGTVLGGIESSTLADWCRQAAEAAGLAHKVKGRPTHIFRSTYATYLLDAGVAPQVVAQLLGHETIATLDPYAAILKGRKHEAAAGLRAPR